MSDTETVDINIGDAILYVDPYGVPHKALVTQVWGMQYQNPSINLIYVVPEKDRTDPYGRQVARNTSVVPWSNQPAHGNYYIPLDKSGNPIAELNPYSPPREYLKD